MIHTFWKIEELHTIPCLFEYFPCIGIIIFKFLAICIKFLKICKIRFRKNIFFKLLAPRQFRNKFLCTLDKIIKLFWSFFINNSNKAFKLSPSPQRIKISFDKSNVRLNNWPHVLDPKPLAVLVFFNLAKLKVFYISYQHILLNWIAGKKQSFFQIFHDLTHEKTEILGRDFQIVGLVINLFRVVLEIACLRDVCQLGGDKKMKRFFASF